MKFFFGFFTCSNKLSAVHYGIIKLNLEFSKNFRIKFRSKNFLEFSEFLEFILRLTWFQLDCPQLDSRLRDTIYSYFCLCLVTNLFFTVLFMPFNNVPFNVLFYLTCLIIFFGHFRGHLRSLRSNVPSGHLKVILGP